MNKVGREGGILPVTVISQKKGRTSAWTQIRPQKLTSELRKHVYFGPYLPSSLCLDFPTSVPFGPSNQFLAGLPPLGKI